MDLSQATPGLWKCNTNCPLSFTALRSMTMFMLRPVVLLVVASFTICSAETIAESGPYKMHFTHFGACDDPGKGVFVYNVVTDYQNGDKEKPCFTGNISLNADLNDDVTAKLHVQFLKNDTWKDYLNLTFKKGCSDTMKHEPTWFDLMKTVNIHVNECPIPKGVYSFKCVTFNGITMKSRETLKYGKYRVFKSFWEKGTMIGCMTTEGTATPA